VATNPPSPTPGVCSSKSSAAPPISSSSQASSGLARASSSDSARDRGFDLSLDPVGLGNAVDPLDDVPRQAEGLGLGGRQLRRPLLDLGPELPGRAVGPFGELLGGKVLDPPGGRLGGAVDRHVRADQRHRQRPGATARFGDLFPPTGRDVRSGITTDRYLPRPADHRRRAHHQVVAGECHQPRVPARLHGHVGHRADAAGVEPRQPSAEDEALVGFTSAAVDPQADEVDPFGDEPLDPPLGPRDDVAADDAGEVDDGGVPAFRRPGIGEQGTLEGPQPPRQLGRVLREQRRQPERSRPASRRHQWAGADILDFQDGRRLAECGDAIGRDELVAILGRRPDDAGGRIHQRHGQRLRHGTVAAGDLRVGRPDRVVDGVTGQHGGPELRLGRDHDLLAGQCHEHGMAADALRQERDRLDRRQTWRPEKSGEFETVAEVADIPLVTGGELDDQDPTLAGAWLQPLHLTGDRRHRLLVAGPGDRQPDDDPAHARRIFRGGRRLLPRRRHSDGEDRREPDCRRLQVETAPGTRCDERRPSPRSSRGRHDRLHCGVRNGGFSS